MGDVSRIKRALGPVEHGARGLPWARERPWKTKTHVGTDAGMPTIDLHDLGRSGARDAVERTLALSDELDAGALCFVVGRGRHSVGGAVLPQVVREQLDAAAKQQGWRVRAPRSGRLVLIIDPARAPASATGALGWGFWLWVAFVAVAASIALWRAFVG